VVFSFAVTRDRTIVSVVDEGIGFDIRGLPDPTHRMNLEREHGRGIFLVRNYVDEVGQNERGNGVYFVRNNPAKA
jgi:serine/threonine-protein kinase RsbW